MTCAAGGITAGVPGLADILEQDWSEGSASRPAHSEPTPLSLTPRSVPVFRPARSAPPLMTPLTEETEADLRSTSHAQGQSGTFGQLGTGYLSTAGQGEHPSSLPLSAASFLALCALAQRVTTHAYDCWQGACETVGMQYSGHEYIRNIMSLHISSSH